MTTTGRSSRELLTTTPDLMFLKIAERMVALAEKVRGMWSAATAGARGDGLGLRRGAATGAGRLCLGRGAAARGRPLVGHADRRRRGHAAAAGRGCRRRREV